MNGIKGNERNLFKTRKLKRKGEERKGMRGMLKVMESVWKSGYVECCREE